MMTASFGSPNIRAVMDNAMSAAGSLITCCTLESVVDLAHPSSGARHPGSAPIFNGVGPGRHERGAAKTRRPSPHPAASARLPLSGLGSAAGETLARGCRT